MGRVVDLTGKVFKRLTVLTYAGKTRQGASLWNCICECGTKRVVRGDSLSTGNTNSCGCYNRDIMSEQGKTANRTHGQTVNRTPTPTYKGWAAMLTRCTNPHNNRFKYYGGKTPPVTVCKEWETFEGFYASMGSKPDGTSLGRILDRGNYEPGNVFWMTPEEQALAKRGNCALRHWVEEQHA